MKPIGNDEWDKKAKKWVVGPQARLELGVFDEMLKDWARRSCSDNDIRKHAKAITDAITEHKFPHDVCWMPIIEGPERGEYCVHKSTMNKMLEIAQRYRAQKIMQSKTAKLRTDASSGLPIAQYALGLAYWSGDGIEYNAYPPPPILIKVMERCWAEKFIKDGSMRFGSIESYRNLEDAALADRREGIGILCRNGHPHTVESANPVYVWCAAKCDITSSRILHLAEKQYDCLVRIRKPEILMRKVKNSLGQKKLHLHCGDISYNKESAVSKQTLTSQKFHFNVFQKDSRFSGDCEYRLSITDIECKSIGSQPKTDIILNVGDCSAIADIEDLPI